MIDFSYDIQRIIINALRTSTDSVLVEKVGTRIYDYVPLQSKNTPIPYPFIMIGKIVSVEWHGGGDCCDGVVSNVTVNVYSDHRGKAEILLIGNAISRILKTLKEDEIMKIHNVKFLKSVYDYAEDDRLVHFAEIDFQLTISN